ncbi:MAG: macro domain-containing protein [Lachnospiraceae bacterium]|nr:macro domain-containing protein [Lachnospiraceae bacterium]
MRFELINDSCAKQEVDAVVNAANKYLLNGGGIAGVIFSKAGVDALTNACKQYKTPIKDGEAVITPSFGIKNAKAIIHAVGPDFSVTPKAFKELYEAYYNSLIVLKENGYHSISFPLISAGIFGGNLPNPAAESTKQCCRAYKKFSEENPTYNLNVLLCAYSSSEYETAMEVFKSFFKDVPPEGYSRWDSSSVVPISKLD